MHPRLSPPEFRQLLLAVFPREPYLGPISGHTGYDDGNHLRASLPGHRWDELTPGFLFHASVALRLLHASALRVFLPAWLLHSTRNTSPDDFTTDFTIYFLCPGNPTEGFEAQHAAGSAALSTPGPVPAGLRRFHSRLMLLLILPSSSPL